MLHGWRSSAFLCPCGSGLLSFLLCPCGSGRWVAVVWMCFASTQTDNLRLRCLFCVPDVVLSVVVQFTTYGQITFCIAYLRLCCKGG